MMLTGPGIVTAMKRGEIDIEPFCPDQLNPNSYNLRLGPDLIEYGYSTPIPSGTIGGCLGTQADVMDTAGELPPGKRIEIPPGGLQLEPGRLYLGHTIERVTAHHPWAPLLEGRSSMGRRGISVHLSAGFGDHGFSGQWTLEITVLLPTIVYPDLQLAQVCFLRLEGEPMPYQGRYQGQVGPTPAYTPERKGS